MDLPQTSLLLLTHFQLMFHYYTPPKTSENLRFYDVFKGFRSGTAVENGLSEFKKLINFYIFWSYQKKQSLLIISGGIEVNLLKFAL